MQNFHFSHLTSTLERLSYPILSCVCVESTLSLLSFCFCVQQAMCFFVGILDKGGYIRERVLHRKIGKCVEISRPGEGVHCAVSAGKTVDAMGDKMTPGRHIDG